MRYVEFRDAIGRELRRCPSGLTWVALKERLKLRYGIPCPEWVRQMEQEVGLVRERGSSRAFTWKLVPSNGAGRVRRTKRNQASRARKERS